MYIICAKNIQYEPYITDPLKRTEICTEMIYTRMRALQLLGEGKINSRDTIVTRKDRFCLYENIFENVIDWDVFLHNVFAIDHNNVIDLVSEINNGVIDSDENYKKFFPVLNDHVFDISLRIEDFNKFYFSKKPFVCILNRQLPNGGEKNLSHEYIISLINEFVSKDIHVFIFGNFPDYKFNWKYEINISLISSFKEWCTILSHENCKSVISSCSGGVYPLFFVGNEKSRLIIIDPNSYSEIHKDSPSFYNKCINFKKVKIDKYFYSPDPKLLSELIINDL